MEEGELFQNKYRIGKLLGEGAMGVVYAATQQRSGLRVAIKFVSAKSVSERNINGERLVREATVLAKLNHNNLVRLYDFDETPEGDYFIVMELVEGSPLRALIRRARKDGKNLDSRQVLHVMSQVAEGMVAAHDAGVIHRDLKPENIIVSEGRIARVVDFGLAKNPGTGAATPSGIETNPASVVGTPRYMAPEQVRGGEIDARTDIFAIGVTMYEALTGRFPFERDDDEVLGMTEVFARQCYAEPTPLREHLPGCSPRVAKIVLRCLSKEPADRYQTARALAWDIRAALAEEFAEEAHAPGRQQATAANDERQTAPIQPQWAPGPALPFAPSNSAPVAPSPAYVVRETAPMPPPGPAGPPQPTYAATQPVGRGVGYTTKMQRPSSAALAAAEEDVARERSAASPVPSVAPSSGPVARHADFRRDSDRPTRPSPASSSGVHAKQEHRAPREPASTWPSEGANAPINAGSEPHAMSSQHPIGSFALPDVPRATPPSPARRPRFWGLPPLFVAPVVGTGLAVAALVALMLVRAPSRRDTPRGMPVTTGSAPTLPPAVVAPVAPPDSNSTAAPPTAAPPTADPTATPGPADEPTAAPSSSATSAPTSPTVPSASATGPAASPRARTNARSPLHQPLSRPSEPRGAELPQPSSRKRPEVPAQPATTAAPARGRLFGDDQ